MSREWSRTTRRSKGGKRDDLDGLYLRSTWEANVARILNLLIEKGYVETWDYEPDEFEFTPIKRGTRFYRPDFRVQFKAVPHVVYFEIKGYMDDTSRVKLKRMGIYYPQVALVVVNRHIYKELERLFREHIPNWED